MPVSQLKVEVAELRNARGVLQFCLTADPDNFPNCVDDARAVSRVVPAGDRAMRFDALPHGNYAIAVFHDENANRKLDTFAGIPREGFGFSRNPRIGFGPPRFSAARFAFGNDAQIQQVKLRYML
ncbi:DUF2141 domain-containing protein [Sphingomonas sp. S1-29]|nr:DUF2141 domain-containing protein [Sphingomonas sp. S1-29]